MCSKAYSQEERDIIDKSIAYLLEFGTGLVAGELPVFPFVQGEFEKYVDHDPGGRYH